MKLLIDEMYPPVIAERLRDAGHDAVSVIELPDLIGPDDAQICELAVSTVRSVVTEHAADFLMLVKQRSAVGQAAPSLVTTSNGAFSRHSRSFVGRAMRAPAAFCDRIPETIHRLAQCIGSARSRSFYVTRSIRGRSALAGR